MAMLVSLVSDMYFQLTPILPAFVSTCCQDVKRKDAEFKYDLDSRREADPLPEIREDFQ